MVTEEKIELLKGISLEDGRNSWEYVNLFGEEKRDWVGKAILSCIDKGLMLRPENISKEASNLKYSGCDFIPTKEQLERVASHEFWLNSEKGRKFQEFLPPYTVEQVIEEMKARGQYNPTGWPL